MDNLNLILLNALTDLYNVLDKKTQSGLSVNQQLPKEIFDLFYNPAVKARAAMLAANDKVLL